jgi:hypothetical protein
MDVEFARHGGLDLVEELAELGGPVPSVPGSTCAKFSTTGKSLRSDLPNLSSPQSKNISLYRNYDLQYKSPVPRPHEGRFAIVTMRWAQDAMDAAVSGATACFPKGIKVRRRTKGCRVR